MQTSYKVAGVRNLKKWVLLSGPETRSKFLAKIRDYLLYSLHGNLEYLDDVEPSVSEKTEIRQSRIKLIIRGLVTGFIPLVVLAIVQETPFAIQETVLDYFPGGCIIWVVLSLLAVIDPSYSEKIASLKNIVLLFPGGK